jgi:hypothetical protein
VKVHVTPLATLPAEAARNGSLASGSAHVTSLVSSLFALKLSSSSKMRSLTTYVGAADAEG